MCSKHWRPYSMAASRVFAFLLLYTLFESSENSELCQNMAIKDCAKDLIKAIQRVRFEERTQETKFTECKTVQVRWFRTRSLKQCKMSIRALITLYRIAFAPALKPYRMGLLFTRKNGHFGAIFETKRIFNVESHISDRCSHPYTGYLSVSVRKNYASFFRSFEKRIQ